jgi:hypothetical protein
LKVGGKQEKLLSNLIEKCQKILSEVWSSVTSRLAEDVTYNVIPQEELRQAIFGCINSKTKSYRYVLPTQIIAKISDPSLDSRCIQASRGGKGAFDARSVCDKVIVPFDRQNHNVLGGAPEPYVNNPLRVGEISSEFRANQKDKIGWDALILVLNEVEKRQNADFTKVVFEQVLLEIYRRLSVVQIIYPIPKRVSLEQTQEIISKYISVPSGGERVLTITSALMELIGDQFHLFAEVRRGNITAADKPSGLVADIECRDKEGNILLAVEVKDKELILNHIESKLPSMRSNRVSEILYIAQQGISQKNGDKISELIKKEFVSGQNIYIFDSVSSFSSGILVLVGEIGRRKFLENVSSHLDKYGAAIQHKKDWATLLSQL